MRCQYENKIILMLIWLIQYPRYSVLSVKFGVSEFIVSKIVEKMLPYFVSRFSRFIPHRRVSSRHSELSKKSSQLLIDFDGNIIVFAYSNWRSKSDLSNEAPKVQPETIMEGFNRN